MSAVGTGTDVTLVVPRSIASKIGLSLRRRLSKLPLKANDNPSTLDS
jgi:hypothetical protein